MYVCLYIYIYIYMCACIYIYIYIHKLILTITHIVIIQYLGGIHASVNRVDRQSKEGLAKGGVG